MSDSAKGTNRKLSPARKMVIEMLHHARKVPSVPVARSINVAVIAEARKQAHIVPSWTTVFIRAYGLVARERSEFRRALIPWPYPHLYEHPHSVCALVIEREWEGETVLLGAKIRAPEEMALETIEGHIRRLKETPVWEISDFRQALRIGKLPAFLRRFTFWQSLYLSGAKRAKRMGTFMVSSYGSLGSEQLHPLTFHTSLFTFGPVSPAGNVVVKIVYDHRVMDGRYVARALEALEKILHSEILMELRSLRRKAA
jgi:hypothetical protein